MLRVECGKSPRWILCLLCLSLSACSRDGILRFAESTRDRVHISGAEAKSVAAFEDGAVAEGDYLITRRPVTPPVKKMEDETVDDSKPTPSPFAPMIEPEPGATPEPK